MKLSHIGSALLLAGILLAGCDISSSGGSTPVPAITSAPARATLDTSDGSGNATAYPAPVVPPTPSPNPAGYPEPSPRPTATFDPAYIPPATPQS